MEFLQWFTTNIGAIIGIACLIAVLMIAIVKFIEAGKEQQITKIKEWLLFAVSQAEKELGSNTGQLKLRMVYSQFIDKFKFMSFLITFEQFSLMVDEALDTMKDMLANNKAVKKLIEGDQGEQI